MLLPGADGVGVGWVGREWLAQRFGWLERVVVVLVVIVIVIVVCVGACAVHVCVCVCVCV